MIVVFQSNPNEFRPLTLDESLIAKKIINKNIKAHNNENCFCDKFNNLYSISVIDKTAYLRFIKSKVNKINNSQPLGYYEVSYPVYESIAMLFSHFPNS